MRQIIITTIFFIGLISSIGQSISEDTYCIKLRKSSSSNHFNGINLDSIPAELRTFYEKGLSDWGNLLSRFNEEPIINSKRETFRSIKFGPFNNPKDVVIMKIEKCDTNVEITIKFIQKIRDSTILVHKKLLEMEVWDKFEEVAAKYFISQPSIKVSKSLIRDGSTTVYEGSLSNRYHYLERYMMSTTDPDLEEVNMFIFRTAGTIFDINCKKDTREN